MPYAWATITGKVFVEDIEIEDARDAIDLDEDRTFDEVEAFKFIATEKLYDLAPTDDPFRIQDISIDLSTYHG